MSRTRLVVVLAVPFLFAALPLVSLAFSPGSNRAESVPSIVTVMPEEVAPGPDDTLMQLPLTASTAAAGTEQHEPLAYNAGPEAHLDCSQWSSPHIDG